MLVLSAWNNVVVTRLPGHPGSYVVVNVAATGSFVAAARVSGLTWGDIGLGRPRLPDGLRWGAAASAAVACGYGVALAVPGLRPLLDDARTADLDGRQLVHQALVRIPLGTVLWEEVAFRGVLLAALARLSSVRAATVASSTVFGIWHVRPTAEALSANGLADGPVVRAGAVVAAGVATGAAGLAFGWLRLRSGSLLAPVLVHVATNSLGILAGAVARRRS
ncbi:CPBP family intramembrane glutamic endopeptidase [Blastococcus deserti]|uniref:CPBP family intramembrane glutamic endopeptidase n=1 Tax=Blastococcus deserti TaxID=2259033 RepID=A0ABW4X988_9ACTN